MVKAYIGKKFCIVPASNEIEKKLMDLQAENFRTAQEVVRKKNAFQSCFNECIANMSRSRLQNRERLTGEAWKTKKSEVFRDCARWCERYKN